MAAGGGGDVRGVGGVETIAEAAVGEGCSGVAHAGDGSPSDESCDGDVRVGEESGGEVGSHDDRAGEGGVVERGEANILLLPTTPHQLSLTPPSCCLPCPLSWRWRGVRRTWRELGQRAVGAQVSSVWAVQSAILVV